MVDLAALAPRGPATEASGQTRTRHHRCALAELGLDSGIHARDFRPSDFIDEVEVGACCRTPSSSPGKAGVTLTTRATASHILIDVEDACGGLPPGGADRSGLGLGLAISRRGVEANGGELHVRDLPGKGCVFTIGLPRLLV
jgi:hypothetical protein